MLTNMELYGTDDVPTVDKETCNRRLYLLDKRLKDLLKVGYMDHNNYLINKVMKAQKHWVKLRDGEAV